MPHSALRVKKMKQTTFFPCQKHKHDESKKWAKENRLLNQGVLSHSLLWKGSKFFHSRVKIYSLLEHSLHDWNRECFRKLHGVWRLEQVLSKRVLIEYSKVMIGKHQYAAMEIPNEPLNQGQPRRASHTAGSSPGPSSGSSGNSVSIDWEITEKCWKWRQFCGRDVKYLNQSYKWTNK